MKRFHLHVAVDDLPASIRFYSHLFGAEPAVTKADYAKWMLEDPRINFAISARGAKPGLDHLGIQVDSPEELAALREQLKAADVALHAEGETVCCYAKGDKSWLKDPAGIPWEAYHTMEAANVFGSAPTPTDLPVLETACCSPDFGGKCS